MSTSRRDFIKIAAVGAAGTALLPPVSRAAGKTVSMLHESSFIKTFDEYMQKTLAPAYEKETGVKINYELTSVGSLPTRVSTVAETGAGADITMNYTLLPFLFDEKYVDVADIAEDVGKKQGGWYPAAKEAVFVNGKWKGVPFANIGQLMNWRTDWFKEVGVTKFPDTWEELYEVGKKLKAKDHPFGFELGHGFGDNHGWLYPLLWSYGGAEVEADGKTVVIDSDETARAIDFARKFFRDTMLEDVLGWTDVSNNKAWMAEQISCTNNAESILWFAKRDFPDIGKVTDQAMNPQGPKGRFHLLGPISHSIFTSSPVQDEARAFSALDDGRKAARALVRLGRQLLPAADARLRQRADVGCRAAQQAVPRLAQQRPSAGLAGAGQPAIGRERRQIRHCRHVRQSLRRRSDKGGHRHRRRPVEGDLQGRVREELNLMPRVLRDAPGLSSGRPQSLTRNSSWAKRRISSWLVSGEAAGEEAEVCEQEPGRAAFDGCFEILGEASAAAEPGEAALDHPAPGQQLKAFDAGRAARRFRSSRGRNRRPPPAVAGPGRCGRRRRDAARGSGAAGRAVAAPRRVDLGCWPRAPALRAANPGCR